MPNLGALLDRLEELRTLVRQERQGPAQGLILSTIHASKGLEYQRVILMDVADGLLPLSLIHISSGGCAGRRRFPSAFPLAF